MPADVYPLSYLSAMSGQINWSSDTIKVMLTTSAYTPDLSSHRYKSDVTNEVTGTGYTAGGATLASKTATLTAANSWGTSRANSTAYATGTIVRPATGNGYLYQAIVGGTTGASVPTYPTVIGQSVTDGGVTWVCVGRAIIVFDAADPSWPSSTITARRVVGYKDTGTASTSPLIFVDDLGSDQSSSGAAWTYAANVQGMFAGVV